MINNEVLTLSTCWQIKLTDGTALGFTDSDEDLVIDGTTYHASSGFGRSAVESNTSLKVDNLETIGLIDHELIKHEDLISGRFDHAEVSVFLSDHHGGKLDLRTGWLGEVTANGNSFTAEIRGLLQAFSQNIGELYSPQCRAQLGDKRCKVALQAFEGKVSRVEGEDAFICWALRGEDDYYRYGKLKFNSGANAGFETEILSHIGPKLILSTPTPNPISSGDNFTLYPGCDRHLRTCHKKFQNTLNFRGEPFIPSVGRFLF